MSTAPKAAARLSEASGSSTSRYFHLALDALKNALTFTGEAKEYSRQRLLAKAKAYAAALTNYLNACLYIVEANRSLLQQNRVMSKSYEQIRAMAINAKIIAHYRKNLRVEVVEILESV
jgi:hypothetical protein